MFFDDWYDLVRILIVGVGAYAALIFLLRATGKRTLSKMNAFDFVVTVALGSTLATVLLSRDVSLAEGVLAFALLCGLQYAVAFVSVRSKRFEGLVKAEPTLLFFRGRMLPTMLKKERVTQEEVLAAMRAQGISSPSDVDAVVLETDGTISIVPGSGDETPGALANVGPRDGVRRAFSRAETDRRSGSGRSP